MERLVAYLREHAPSGFKVHSRKTAFSEADQLCLEHGASYNAGLEAAVCAFAERHGVSFGSGNTSSDVSRGCRNEAGRVSQGGTASANKGGPRRAYYSFLEPQQPNMAEKARLLKNLQRRLAEFAAT